MAFYHITFEPVGQRGQCSGDECLLDCARRHGVGISSICGGQGICLSCKVRVVNGTVSEPTRTELGVLLPSRT